MKPYVTKYMTFCQQDNRHGHSCYSVQNNKSGAYLAGIFWYQPWRQYVLRPLTGSEFNDTCLMEIYKFLIKLNQEALRPQQAELSLKTGPISP